MMLINTLVSRQCRFRPENHYPLDYGPQLQDGEEFDFIVVGAGSAGSAIAEKLTQKEEYKVLVLEAGGYPSVTSDVSTNATLKSTYLLFYRY